MDVGRRTGRLSKRFVKPSRSAPSMQPQPRLDDCWYSVVDVETTGIAPSDQVIEIAIVRFTGDGKGSDHWTTLINPGRDLGPYQVHRLNRFSYVRHAPRFADVAADVAARLKGTVLCAHNLSYERRFLGYEFARLSAELPELPGLCTLRLGSALGSPYRRLEEACLQLGIVIDGAHTALGDAWATARLLAAFLTMARLNGVKTLGQLGCTTPFPAPDAWPEVARPGAVPALPREQAEAEYGAAEPTDEPNYLAKLAGRLPAAASAAEVEYVSLLDRVLADFEVTLAEANALRVLAEDTGLAAEQTQAIHHRYLEQMVLAAWEDGVISPDEKRQLRLLASLLSVGQGPLLELLERHRPV